MALSNLFGWKKSETEAGSACGAACGAADKPAEKPAACGTACGAADKPEGSNRPGDDCFERTGAERRQGNETQRQVQERLREDIQIFQTQLRPDRISIFYFSL